MDSSAYHLDGPSFWWLSFLSLLDQSLVDVALSVTRFIHVEDWVILVFQHDESTMILYKDDEKKEVLLCCCVWELDCCDE